MKGAEDFRWSAPDPRLVVPTIPTRPTPERSRVIILVNGNLDAALKLLKKSYLRDVAKVVKRHRAYTKPGEARRMKSKLARRRRQKQARREAQGEDAPPAMTASARLAMIDRTKGDNR